MISRRCFCFLMLSSTLLAQPQTTAEWPLGFWSDAKTGLYVSVDPADATAPGSETFVVGKRWLQIGGPPPGKNKADDVFIPKVSKFEKGVLTVTGSFNWGPDNALTVVKVMLEKGHVTLEIEKSAEDSRYAVGRYVLRKRQ